MTSARTATIRQRLTWMSALASSGALLLAGVAFFGVHVVSFRSTLVRNLLVQADTISLASVAALQFDDARTARETLAALAEDANVIAAAIYAADGGLFASYRSSAAPAAAIAPFMDGRPRDIEYGFRSIRIHRPIESEGVRTGAVHVVYGLGDLYADAARYGLIAVVVLAISLLASVGASSIIQRGFSEPIASLVDAATRVSANQDYSVRVEPTRRRDELAALIDTFNGMLARIQSREAEIEAANARFQELNEQLEQRVQQRTAELEATNKELEAFTYSVSHDLRAPLRRIDGFGKLLMEEYSANLPPDAARYLSRVREGAREMGLLVDDLLNLTRVGRQELRLQVAGLSPIVRKVADAVTRDAGDRQIDWRLQTLPFVECDPALMEVVFTNLLSNAVKYTRPRDRAVIEVGTVEHDRVPVVFVRDNGVGFSMKYAGKLFGVFQRLHRAEDFEGTGVGLATVQRIIHKHGGTIWAEAELDKGACFSFTIGAPAPPSAVPAGREDA